MIVFIAMGLFVLAVSVGVGFACNQTMPLNNGRRAKVLKLGEPGWARIVGWTPTGFTMGKDDVLRFSLVVQPDAGGPEMMAQTNRRIRPMEVPQFQVGMAQRVRVLRDNTGVLVEFEQ